MTKINVILSAFLTLTLALCVPGRAQEVKPEAPSDGHPSPSLTFTVFEVDEASCKGAVYRTEPAGIDSHGTVVGTYSAGSKGDFGFYMLADGTLTPLTGLGAGGSLAATAIYSDGTIVG
jgi:hypothetical protein